MAATRFVPALFAALVAFLLAWFDGGFYALTWGVASLGLLGVCGATTVLADQLPFSRLALASLAGLWGFALWTFASGLWTSDLTKTVRDAELAFVYPIALMAALLIARRSGATMLIAGTLVGMVAICAYALGGRLAPDLFGFPNAPAADGRLYSPIGYWNGLAAIAAIATLVAGGLAAARLPVALRAVAAASLVVTVPTLYLTFSRGALWAATAGLVVLVAVSPERLRLVATLAAVLPWAGAAIGVIHSHDALTASHLQRQAVTRAGHAVLPPLAVLAFAAAVSCVLIASAQERVLVPVRFQRVVGTVLLASVCLALAAVVVHRGGPISLEKSISHSLEIPYQRTPTPDLNQRLSDVSPSGRLDQWRVAWTTFRAHPIVGVGAGGWEAQWLRYEPYNDYNQRPHSLYLEVLAELGLIGTALLALALIPPALAFSTRRREPIACSAVAGFSVFLFHAAVDWDWQLPGVTVPALMCAACLLAVAGPRTGIRLTEGLRWTLTGIMIGLALAAAITLQGNRLVSAAADNVALGKFAAARSEATKARTWLPWSYEPDTWAGEARLQAGDRRGAAASFRRALSFDSQNWRLWFDLARASSGAERRRAVAHVRMLYPLSPELAALCASAAFAPSC